jgi:hypothetical protein
VLVESTELRHRLLNHAAAKHERSAPGANSDAPCRPSCAYHANGEYGLARHHALKLTVGRT